MRLVVMLCFALVSSGLGCASGPASVEGSSTTVYFVLEGSDWILDEAIDRKDYLSSEGLPSLDWYAEYEAAPDDSDAVRLSGHDAGLAEVREGLQGFDLRPIELREGSGLGGTGPDGRSIVLFAADDGYTMLVESEELDVDALGRWTDGLRRVTGEEWIAAGGVVPRCCGREDR